MRIYLLNPPFKPNFVRCGRWQGVSARSGGLDYPKFLAYTTGLLEEYFSDVRLVDAVAKKWDREDVIKDVSDFKPDLIIVSSNFSSLSNDTEVTSLLKDKTSAISVIVGPPTSQYPEKILQNPGVDIVARFEYDLTIKELAITLKEKGNLKNVKGISYKQKGTIINNEDRPYSTSEDLDEIPFVSKVYKKHLNIKDYFLSQSLYPEVQIFTGRGCPNLCTFCSWPKTLTGRKYRSRSAESIVDEFEWIKENLPEVKEIFIEDDTFTINKKLVKDVCYRLIDHKINATWSCNARADLDFETMDLMKKAGCRLLIVGYESGNDVILSNIKKGVTKDQLLEFSKDAKKARLQIHADFIIGLPGENKTTINDTVDFIHKIKPNMLQVAIASPIPGTEFYDYVKKNGLLLENDIEKSIDENGFQRCIIEYPDLKQQEISDHVDEILRNYYINPSFVPVVFENFIMGRGFEELKIIFKSAKDFLKYSNRGK